MQRSLPNKVKHIRESSNFVYWYQLDSELQSVMANLPFQEDKLTGYAVPLSGLIFF
jgi:hypothetical protein